MLVGAKLMSIKTQQKRNIVTFNIKFGLFLYKYPLIAFIGFLLVGVLLDYLLFWYVLSLDFWVSVVGSVGLGILIAVLLYYFIFSKNINRYAKIIEKLATNIANDAIENGKFPTQLDLVKEFNLDMKIASNVYLFMKNNGILDNLMFYERVQKKVVGEAEKFGGILSISKAYVNVNVPLGVIQKIFARLERMGLIRKVTGTVYDFRGIREFSDDQRKILEIAEANGGVLTIEEASKVLHENIEKINAILEDFENKGIAIKSIEKGAQVWYFPGIIKTAVQQQK